MRTMSMLKGMPVFDMKTGVIVGEICDLSISSNGNVDGVLVKKKGFFKHSCLLDVHDISSFGNDGVMIEDAEKLKSIKTPPDYTFFHHQSLTGKMLYSRQGESLGMLKDVYFMEELGTIVGYEITDGFFSDISEGKRVIKSMQPATIGKDAIIVNVNPT